MSSTPKRPMEAWLDSRLFEIGMGHLVVSRFKANDLVEAGVFLVDGFCLGIKDAFYTARTEYEYRNRLLKELFEEAGEHLQPLEPTCARKLVEGAVAYAANLGFAPAPGYKAACRVFGGVKADQCPTAFVFGNKGKPCFIRGPRDTPEKCRLILNLLHTRCGEGNYEFVLSDADVDQVFGNWT